MDLIDDRSDSAPAFLAPSRPRLTELRSLLSRAFDARQAWRALAAGGHIPASWLDDPARRFVSDPGDRYRSELPTRDPALSPLGPHPSRIEHCALFAADVGGILAAEAGVRTLAERLAPWGAPPCTCVVWWAIPRSHYGYASTDTRPGVYYALPFAFSALYRSFSRRDDRVPRSPFGNARRCAILWQEQAARGNCVPIGVERVVRRLAGRAFAELPNPFEPLAELEEAGYATLEYSGGLVDGAAFLVVPT